MFCSVYCIIAAVFLIANIYSMFSIQYSREKIDFFNTLEPSQKETYIKIINERKNIYYASFILGIVLSIFCVFVIQKFIKPKRLTKNNTVCIIVSSTFIFNYLFYILYPKSSYMIQHLNDKRQVDEWLKVYRTMQVKYHTGFVFGIIAVALFSFGYCK